MVLSIGEAEMHAKRGQTCTMMVNSLHLSLDLFKKLLQLVLVASLHGPLDAEAFLLVGLGDHVDLKVLVRHTSLTVDFCSPWTWSTTWWAILPLF